MESALALLDRFCIVSRTDVRIHEAAEQYRGVLALNFSGATPATVEKLNEISDTWIKHMARRNVEIAFTACALYLDDKDRALLVSVGTVLAESTELNVNGSTPRTLLVSYLLWRHALLVARREVYISPAPASPPELDLARMMGDVRL
ncbi:hypothetical protein GGS21DRAFT_525685 [Xylaria nigripes]|nr:hypothetical protein GGS21DRAFT_525685 [Xylaria nigripes]